MNPPATKKPLVYLITAGSLTDQNYQDSSTAVVDLIAQAARSGVQLIQIREKAITAGRVFDLSRRAKAASDGTAARILINDRTDVALAARCDGVHLTSTSIPVKTVRQHVPSGFVIGVSTHTPDEVASAADGGADFAVFGPVFDSPGKSQVKGLVELQTVAESVQPFPVLALGGIDESNVSSVLGAGAAGFAAIRLLNDVDHLRHITETLEL